MWIVFAVLCMVVLTAADIIANKAVSSDELAPIKLRISVMGLAFIMGILIYLLKLGESGIAPWMLIVKYPLIVVAVACMVLSELIYLISLSFVSMSIMEAISSFEGIVIFAGMIMINMKSGRLEAINEMFAPARLILICIILAFTILLPNIELIVNKKKELQANIIKERYIIAIGILIALAAVLLGASDSLLMDAILDEGKIGVIDFMMSCCFASIIPLPLFMLLFCKKRKTAQIPSKAVDGYSVKYGILYVVQSYLGVTAVSIDAVRSEILFFSFPVIAIIGAKLFLKEKYTWRQNLCIWVITIAAILFCVIDYFV